MLFNILGGSLMDYYGYYYFFDNDDDDDDDGDDDDDDFCIYNLSSNTNKLMF